MKKAARTALPGAALVATVANTFQRLNVGATLWFPGRWAHKESWFEIFQHSQTFNLLDFEEQHGAEVERVKYNAALLERVRRERRSVLSEYRGYFDVFVPVVVGVEVVAILVSGPILGSRPTAAELLERWRVLTGRQGHPTDAEFVHFLHAIQATLVLSAKERKNFLSLCEKAAFLMSAEALAEPLFEELSALGEALGKARAVDRMWEAARSMVNPRTGRIWAGPFRRNRLRELGLPTFPEQVLVGLAASAADADPVDELVRRQDFQRAATELISQGQSGIVGQVGDDGVVLLVATRGSAKRTRGALLELGQELRSLGRRKFGLTIHLGAGPLEGPIPEQYEAALAAADTAMARAVPLVELQSASAAPPALGALRRELGRAADGESASLGARFERYLEAVVARSGGLQVIGAHLEAGLERISEKLFGSGTLDEKSHALLWTELARAARDATELNQLLDLYRNALTTLTEASRDEGSARQHRSLLRAEQFVRAHYSEPLSLERVARVAGFAPTYFSELFHKKQKVTFERYLTGLRIERARQLLASPSLSLSRIAELSGFSNRHYFGNAFKRATGETPLSYRRRAVSLHRNN